MMKMLELMSSLCRSWEESKGKVGNPVLVSNRAGIYTGDGLTPKFDICKGQ